MESIHVIFYIDSYKEPFSHQQVFFFSLSFVGNKTQKHEEKSQEVSWFR